MLVRSISPAPSPSAFFAQFKASSPLFFLPPCVYIPCRQKGLLCRRVVLKSFAHIAGICHAPLSFPSLGVNGNHYTLASKPFGCPLYKFLVCHSSGIYGDLVSPGP